MALGKTHQCIPCGVCDPTRQIWCVHVFRTSANVTTPSTLTPRICDPLWEKVPFRANIANSRVGQVTLNTSRLFNHREHSRYSNDQMTTMHY